MCVILMKPIGVKMPNQSDLYDCWESNPHGAGISIADKKKNIIFTEKGFMTFDSLMNYIERIGKKHNLKNSAVMIHFRIASVGKICKEQCHPFPISTKQKDTEKLRFCSDIVFSHNGTLPIQTSGDMSDTQTYACKYLPFVNINSLSDMGYNKLCILKSDGTYKLVGKFIKKDGCYYSNNFHFNIIS